MTDLSAVLFDADGVLQRATPGWLQNLRALVAPEQATDFLDEVMLSEKGPLRGESSFPDELAKVLARWNVTAPLDDILANWTRIDVFPDMVEAVRELRATGTACYLATNQHVFRTVYMRANLGYDDLFDDVFYSSELGLAKPDPAYFGTILERIGRTGAETLFVDDNEPNVEGARAAGLNAEHFPPEAGATALREILDRYDLPR